ncbi:MAG: hypothetical protein ACHQ1D_00300 [Nitrososphaerales archaeon]
MPFEKGNPGRPVGAKGKLATSFKDLVKQTYEAMEATPGKTMKEWAVNNQTDFYKIASKLIPTEISIPDVTEIIITKKIV